MGTGRAGRRRCRGRARALRRAHECSPRWTEGGGTLGPSADPPTWWGRGSSAAGPVVGDGRDGWSPGSHYPRSAATPAMCPRGRLTMRDP
ncbi:hypothetical protein FM125_02375 [Micrococcus lylae]|uniref:Uncharacterized protein n=1 Tax=Micrococcus lylae TaxID=1273 RepID=A0A1R4IGQ1_9MICC|nr:hypothetical protein FM125_02375 [Micrococcus lylae]